MAKVEDIVNAVIKGAGGIGKVVSIIAADQDKTPQQVLADAAAELDAIDQAEEDALARERAGG